MIIDVVMPKMGESITEGTILEWHKEIGELIEKDETLLEIGTDKVDSEIPSPESGTVCDILAKPNDVIDVGNVIARINTDGDSHQPFQKIEELEKIEESEEPEIKKQVKVHKEVKKGEKETNEINKSIDSNSAILTPAVIKLASQNGIRLSEVEMINGSGANGRVTKKDLQNYINSNFSYVSEPVESSISKPESLVYNQDGEKVKIDHMRKMISDHMRYSLDISAHVYIMNEVDMTNIVNFVNENEDSFLSEEGFKLTITPLIILATVNALRDMPEMNSSINGEYIILNNSINIGVAVSIDGGLMVPTISNCDEKNILGLCRELNKLVIKTREKKIGPDELQGSTFTISNFGVFDAVIGTPIINQPNVGILGTGKIKKQPIVIEKNNTDIIAIRSMMMLSLGFDHRLIDGAGGASFISKIKNNLENMNLESLL